MRGRIRFNPRASWLVGFVFPALALPQDTIEAQLARPIAGQQSEPIALSDNIDRAGTLKDGVLTVRLEAREGVWRPSGPNGLTISVAAWAEEGKSLQNPGPLIRVTAGTEVRASVRNSLSQPLTVLGFGESRGVAADSFTIAPGAVHEIRFVASTPGTYYYAGKTDTTSVFERAEHDAQLNGLLVVDPPGETRADDRLFLISWWARLDSTAATGIGQGLIVINGREWPHTERLHVAQGDSVRWRWVNVTAAPHPMHLHGFYFRVDARGDGAADTVYAREQQRLAVTEAIFAGQTMRITWSPERPGNWVFHCHFAGHMTSLEKLNQADHSGRVPAGGMHGSHQSDDHMSMMSGLVLGITVSPRGEVAEQPRDARPIRLVIRSRPEAFGTFAGYGYALGGTPEETSETLSAPGPTLLLEKGQPVAINIVNRTHEGAAVHWHGIELDSYPDGVPGWSGHGQMILPTIAAGDSLTVRFTPPRAGTFMYHSHFNEFMQIGSGLVGAIVVHEPGDWFDPETDRVLLFSDAHPFLNFIAGPFPPAALNGKAQPDTIDLRAGVTHRLRFINIRTEFGVVARLMDGERPAQWRLVAKDGAEVPEWQATMRPAILGFLAGEIYDFEFTPEKAGELRLLYNDGFPPDAKDTEVVIRVK